MPSRKPLSASPTASGQVQELSDLAASIREQAETASLPPVHLWEPGNERDIGLRIARDGTWSYQGSPIRHARLVRLFSRILRHDGGERYVLVTPHEKVRIEVEDAPFLAVEMEAEGAGRDQVLRFRTNVGDAFECNGAHPLRFANECHGEGAKPYALVRGDLWALATRPIYYDLVERAVPEEFDGTPAFGIWSAGAFFALASGARAEALAAVRRGQ